MSIPLFECVPNISEGRNLIVIDDLSLQLQDIEGLEVLHIDSGYDANRTVYTWIGEAEAILNGLIKLFEFSINNIDMSRHEGAHPCIGAVDVIPIIPFKNAALSDASSLVLEIANTISKKFEVPIFLYGRLSRHDEQQHLSQIRKGGYREAAERMINQTLTPDFGSTHIHPALGASCLTARPFMIAYNINLNTEDLSLAKKLATELRKHRSQKEYFNNNIGETSINFDQLSSVRFLAWHMPTFGCCQISTNIYDTSSISIHELYHWVSNQALKMGLRTQGSELVGMTPMSAVHPDATATNYVEFTASLGLNSIKSFDPKGRIIELALRARH